MNNSSITGYCYHNESTKEWLEHLSKSHLSEKKLRYLSVENAVCMPDIGLFHGFSGGVFDQEKRPVELSFQRDGFRTAQSLIEKTKTEDLPFVDKEVVYLGQIRNHWGHFIVDSISRLWFSIENPEKHTYVYMYTGIRGGGYIKTYLNFWSCSASDRSRLCI